MTEIKAERRVRTAFTCESASCDGSCKPHLHMEFLTPDQRDKGNHYRLESEPCHEHCGGRSPLGGTEHFECARCDDLVCYCDGGADDALCSACWSELEHAGRSQADIIARYPA